MVRRAAPVALIIAVSLFAAHAVSSESGSVEGDRQPSSPEAAPGLPSFAGQLDVNVVNLYVAVVDKEGQPVAGLTPEDFRVFEDGREMEITNFAAVTDDASPPDSVTRRVAVTDADADAIAAENQQKMVALLFDGPSLQRRNKKRVARAMQKYIRQNADEQTQFLVAVNDNGLDVMQGFTDDAALLTAHLEALEDRRCAGEAVKNEKRYLKRTLFQTELYRVQGSQLDGVSLDVNWSQAQVHRLMTSIEAVRHRERARIEQSIASAHQLLTAFAGLPGRKSVVWVVEDLATRPAVDIYAALYQLAAPLQGMIRLPPPEVWGQEVELTRPFRQLAAAAQASGATFFILDASDRDREASHIDFSPSDSVSFQMSQSAGPGWTPGADFATVRQRTEGAQYIAFATGGDDVSSGRNIKSALNRLDGQLGTYYSIGYARLEPPDGKRHSVDVRVTRPGVRVRHHEKIIDRTAEQRLADVTMSRLYMDIGANPLDLTVSLGDSEPAEVRSEFIQPIRIDIPIDKLVLLPDAEYHMGQLLVAVTVLGENGEAVVPRLLRLKVSIPSDRYSPDSIATQTVRLLMKEGCRRIAVSVRDEISGVTASETLEMPSRS